MNKSILLSVVIAVLSCGTTTFAEPARPDLAKIKTVTYEMMMEENNSLRTQMAAIGRYWCENRNLLYGGDAVVALIGPMGYVQIVGDFATCTLLADRMNFSAAGR